MQAYCHSPLNNQLYSAFDWLFCSESGTDLRLEKYNSRAFKAFKPAYYNKPISNEFLQTILNDDQYGDNGYGQTPTSGLDGID